MTDDGVMEPSDLADQIESAVDLSRWLHARLDGSAMPGGDRERVAIALFQHSQDLADATTLLLKRNLPGPALVLARPLVEAYTRALWALRCAEDAAVDTFLKTGRPTPWRIADLVDALEEVAPDESKWVRVVTRGLEALHDLAHGGRLHVLGRAGTHAIEPNYAGQDVMSLIGMVMEVQIRAGAELLELNGDEAGMEELGKIVDRLDRRPI